jgi:glycosyltransferase involved in cell wall biosynthesis
MKRHVVLVVENVSLARDHRLRKQARSLLDDGHRVSVVCRADPHNAAAVPGARVHEYPAPADGGSALGFAREYGYSLAAARRRLGAIARRDGCDAIQISGTPDVYFLITARYRRRGIPVVFDQRDLSPELYELRYGRRDAIHRLLLGLERASYRAADHVITVNDSLARIAAARGGLPPGRISVVGNGPVLAEVDRAILAGRRDGAADELRHGRRRLCCWIGVMGPQDRVELALQAVADLVHRRGRTDTHFAFVGDGEARPAAQRLAAELDIADYVSFPGWLGEPDVHRYLATADLGIEPNLEPIVSPVKALEYLAFGVPTVAFDLPETTQLAGSAAAYAPPGDVAGFARLIGTLLDDPRRRAAMAATGRRRVAERLCWEKQATTYLAVYRALLGTGAAPELAGVG